MRTSDESNTGTPSVDDRMIAQSQAGDTEAFRQLVERHQQYAYALAFRIVCDEDDAKDIVQESFIRVWRSIGTFDRSMRFTTWLYRIVVNLAYDCMRAEARKNRLFSASSGASGVEQLPDEHALAEEVSNRDLADRIRKLAAGLSPKQRMVFVLRDLQDMTVAEVADVLKMSEGSVKTNLCYARRQIRNRLG